MPPKIITLLQSRKFWALVTGLVAIGVGVATHQIPYDQATIAAVAGLAAYSVGTGIEAGGQAIGKGSPPEVPHG